jgi:O-antigen/teichoic acid export membrane protein
LLKKNRLFDLNDKSNKTIVVKNTFWLVLDQVLKVVFAIVVGSWTARFLGKTDFGQLSFTITYLALFQIITSLSAEAIVVRELIKNRDIANKILGSIFYLRLGLGVINWICSILIVILIYGLDDNTYVLTLIGGASLVFQSISTIELWFQSNNKSFNIVIPKLASSVIINFLKIVFIINQFSIIYFALLFSFDFLLSGIFLFIAYNKFKVGKKWTFDKGVALRLLKDSWPFLVSATSIYFYTRIDSFIIKKYLGASDLGIYSAAIAISAALPILPMVLLTVLNPIITKKKMESEELYQKFLKKVFQFFGYGGIIFSVIIYMLSDFIIDVLYGANFKMASAVLKAHIFTNVFIYMGIAQNIWIINENKGKLNIYKTAVGVVLSFAANLLLIPKFGLMGAAYSAVLVQLTSSFLINLIIAPEVFKLQFYSLFNKI